MPTFDSQGLRLAYELHGAGRPLVLLHGFAGSFAQNWQATGWVELLTRQGYQVVGLDLRGHGASARPRQPEAYSTAAMVHDIVNLLQHLQLPQAALLGFSMGGALALHVAMRHPERVRQVAVAGVGDPAITGLHRATDLQAISEALECSEPQRITSPLGQQFRAFAERAGNDLQALAAMLRGPGWPAGLTELLPLHCPLLIVAGGADQLMGGTAHLARVYPQARLLTIPDQSHGSIVRDERFKTAVLEFLAAS